MSDAVVSEVGVVEALVLDSVATGSSKIEVVLIPVAGFETILPDVLVVLSVSCLRLGLIWWVICSLMAV